MKKSYLITFVILTTIIIILTATIIQKPEISVGSEEPEISVGSDKFEGFVSVQGDLFTIFYPEEILKNPKSLGGNTILETQPSFGFDPTKDSIYKEISNLDKNQNTVFVYPLFTQSAYEINGFYDYYEGKCERCFITEIFTNLEATYTSSGNASVILSLLGYDFITDMHIDKDPSILQKYDKIILLHNEYVTKKIFDAITSHPKVIYLYPNALYAEIEADYQQKTITLIRGHGMGDVKNGFDWEFENTHPYEYDADCIDWEFYEIDNGIMLNCYPEHVIFKDAELLKAIRDY